MPNTQDSKDARSGNYADLDYSGYHRYQIDDIETGSFEVFRGSDYYTDPASIGEVIDLDAWYYWPCFPGCLPDSDPIGPFLTSADAYHDAQGF